MQEAKVGDYHEVHDDHVNYADDGMICFFFMEHLNALVVEHFVYSVADLPTIRQQPLLPRLRGRPASRSITSRRLSMRIPTTSSIMAWSH